ncbi:TylF/MycF family methyltransferase [Anaerobiospirillum sp. NML120448]|uniref:TylF/MycF family methyltransferase n=1 Tax=Anaerobiospirillum sp. NML120448 TaxID=2932816 RepID=UPI001FF2B71C|nr:TylF/MycF family methyltransferase [Anaerobiospirillum sp. NML120448]MCK0514585.1 TylF/MycF family methyltransferase [Anaerobiospirillum sp. NML120448]
MQLCAEMIASDSTLANSDACVAEAGVWRGYFSSLINAAFKDRTIHLFDTFEGFNKEQVNHDFDKGLIDNFFKDQQDFNSTSIDLVKNNLPFKDKACFHKGLFEDTCQEVKDLKFVFTSLDMDLKQPMAAALEFFYERTLPGDFIFMHDHNHSMIRGIKEVVAEYRQKHGRLAKLPIADEGSSIIIVKS